MGASELRNWKKKVSIEVLNAVVEAEKALHRDAELLRGVEDIIIDYCPDRSHCEVHGTPLLMLKTEMRDVRSIAYPPFTARSVQLYCPDCRSALEGTGGPDWKHAPNVRLLTRGKSPFAMDTVVRSGRMKFLENMRRNEIQETLEEEYGIHASDGALSAMSMEFLARVKCVHMLRFDRLVKDIMKGGGYVLGIDGTGDGDSDRIFAGLDAHRNWVLVSSKIPSESEESMRPHVEFLKERLGPPLTNECDMASSMMNVLSDVFPGVPLRVCDYHFLDDVGSDLMEDDYMAVRKLVISTKLQAHLAGFRKTMFHELEGVDIAGIARELRAGRVPSGLPLETCAKVQAYDIVSWILRYHEDNGGLRFPYSLPHLNFFDRCRDGLNVATSLRAKMAGGKMSPKYLRELESALRDVVEGERGLALRRQVADLRRGHALFEELRERLRVPREKGDIPRDKLIIRSNVAIAEMRAGLEEFRESRRALAADGKHPRESLVVAHLDKYWSHIALDNVVVVVDGKEVVIEIPRTTSGNETCYGQMKADVRKRQGKKDTGRDLNMYGDYLCYVQNLKVESYVSLMYGSLDDMVQAFEEIPPEMLKAEVEVLRKRTKGYDVTNSGLREAPVGLDEITVGLKSLEEWITGASEGALPISAELLGLNPTDS